MHVLSTHSILKRGCTITIHMVAIISDSSCEREVAIVPGLLIYSVTQLQPEEDPILLANTLVWVNLPIPSPGYNENLSKLTPLVI